MPFDVQISTSQLSASTSFWNRPVGYLTKLWNLWTTRSGIGEHIQ